MYKVVGTFRGHQEETIGRYKTKQMAEESLRQYKAMLGSGWVLRVRGPKTNSVYEKSYAK